MVAPYKVQVRRMMTDWVICRRDLDLVEVRRSEPD